MLPKRVRPKEERHRRLAAEEERPLLAEEGELRRLVEVAEPEHSPMKRDNLPGQYSSHVKGWARSSEKRT